MGIETLLLPLPKEIYPVVDSHDRIMRYAFDREKLHQEGSIHRGVHIFIETDHAGFVLQKKAVGTENAGKWSSAVSGHVRHDESYTVAAIREAKEELNLDIDADDLIRIAYMHPHVETGNEFVSLYTYLIDKEDVIDLKSNEVESIIICPRVEVVMDIQLRGDRYSEAFLMLFDTFLKLEESGYYEGS